MVVDARRPRARTFSGGDDGYVFIARSHGVRTTSTTTTWTTHASRGDDARVPAHTGDFGARSDFGASAVRVVFRVRSSPSRENKRQWTHRGVESDGASRASWVVGSWRVFFFRVFFLSHDSGHIDRVTPFATSTSYACARPSSYGITFTAMCVPPRRVRRVAPWTPRAGRLGRRRGGARASDVDARGRARDRGARVDIARGIGVARGRRASRSRRGRGRSSLDAHRVAAGGRGRNLFYARARRPRGAASDRTRSSVFARIARSVN